MFRFLLLATLVVTGIAQGKASMVDYPVQPVPFTAVHFNDTFWLPRIEVNRTVTIPFAFEQCKQSGRMWNFERAAMALKGQPFEDKTPPGFPFDDTDIYKVLEGASYTLSVHPDPRLEAYLDELIALIASAQEPDGYLYTTRTFNPEHPHKWAGTKRWELERELSHELYNLGHLYEAAVAHYQATGKRSLLDIAIKTADLLDRTFGPGKDAIWPGHQITEMGLVKLARATGDERYVKLAKFLLDVRGPDGKPGAGREYNQSHKPVVQQDEAVGHAVRAAYMYSGMADVAAITGDATYVAAIDRIWENVVWKKLAITGGIGATEKGEAFGPNYDLPNLTAYNETCAAIANVYWNHRQFLLHGDAKYIDVLERSLYNGVLSGVSLDGKSFFYPNPLESDGRHARSPWFGCACCPSNLTRFLASVPGYAYAVKDDAIYVNLYAAGTAEVMLGSGAKVKLTQQTNYPWDGQVRVTVEPSRPSEFTVNLRIPGWAVGKPVPSDLYTDLDHPSEPVMLKVNGQSVSIKTENGYQLIRRTWKSGDVIELTLPMPIRRVIANENVEADRGRVALERGPLVYCLEWPDNADGKVRQIVLKDDAPLRAEWNGSLLNGVTAIRGDGFTAIPYYAWANRGKGEMVVWMKRE